MSKYLPTSFLILAIGFAAGFMTSGHRLSDMQEKAGAEKVQYETARLKSEDQLARLTSITEQMVEVQNSTKLSHADYESIRSAIDKGAIDLALAPELAAILERTAEVEIRIECNSESYTCPEYAAAMEKLSENCK